MIRLIALLALLVASAGLAFGQDLPEADEARAQALMRELRCVACENEPVSQSTSDIAENMRARVRVMVAEGASDQEVRDWFEARYGEFVLFRPKASNPGDWLLWGLPFALLIGGGVLGYVVLRRRPNDPERVETVAPEDA